MRRQATQLSALALQLFMPCVCHATHANMCTPQRTSYQHISHDIMPHHWMWLGVTPPVFVVVLAWLRFCACSASVFACRDRASWIGRCVESVH